MNSLKFCHLGINSNGVNEPWFRGLRPLIGAWRLLASHAARRGLTEPLRFRLCVEAGMGANTLRFTAGEAPLLSCERARPLDHSGFRNG